MRVLYRFMGGTEDGAALDSDAPGAWGGFPEDGIPEPVLQVHSTSKYLTIYRLASVDADEAVYIADDAATADARSLVRVFPLRVWRTSLG